MKSYIFVCEKLLENINKSYRIQRSVIVLGIKVVEFERGRMSQLGAAPPGWQALQERVINGELCVVFVQQPNGSPLNRYLIETADAKSIDSMMERGSMQ